MKHVIEPAANRRGAMTGVSEGEKVALKQPDDMRRSNDERDAKSEPWSRRGEGAARLAVEQHEQRVGHRQHHDKILGP